MKWNKIKGMSVEQIIRPESGSNYETPFKSKKTLNVYSIDVGPKGFGFTRNVGNTLLGVHTFNTNSSNSNSTSNECDDECTE